MNRLACSQPWPRAPSRRVEVTYTIRHILTNPIYAGAYALGRSGSRMTIEAGRKRIVRGFRWERSTWEVLIKDHHEGYITWAEFERSQRLITNSANGKSFMSRGSVRCGEALLAGLLRYGHCGRKLHVAYSGTHSNVGRYHCRGSQMNHGGEPCISFGGPRVDAQSASKSSRASSRSESRLRCTPWRTAAGSTREAEST